MSGVELFVEIVYGFQPLTIFAKESVLDVWLSSESASGVFLKCFLDVIDHF